MAVEVALGNMIFSKSKCLKLVRVDKEFSFNLKHGYLFINEVTDKCSSICIFTIKLKLKPHEN